MFFMFNNIQNITVVRPGTRYDRSYPPPGRSFEDDVTTPPRRADFSRSMSTENWRDTKKEKEEEDEGGDWRKAPTRERWGK